MKYKNRKAHMELSDCCLTCAYWWQSGGNESGFCHRFPPVASEEMESTPTFHWQWPTTKDIDWCGEFFRYTGEAPE